MWSASGRQTDRQTDRRNGDNAIRVAVGLRLGSTICESHTCPCDATVDSLGQHALSCRKHPGRVQCHAQINDLIHRALIRAEITSSKEPLGLSRDDGKRPDGLTLVLWHSGHSATWDVTVVHTLAASYVTQSAVQAGKAEEIAAERKSDKYSGLSSGHIFIPVAVESLGPLTDDAHRFISERELYAIAIPSVCLSVCLSVVCL